MIIEKQELQRKLARAVLAFQDSFMARENSPVGLLCQVWLPEETPEGSLQLKSKGMPFCVAGIGDLLALFRCVSCRFNFSANPAETESLGAPGRVYITGEPELTCNVQKYSSSAYLRRAEAEQCAVQSSMLLPIFSLPATHQPRPTVLGVIEVVQTSDDMEFLPVARLLGNVLQKCGLYTSTIEQVQAMLPTTATNLELPLRTGLLGPGGSGHASGEEDMGSGAMKKDPQSGDGSMPSGGGDDDDDDPEEDEDYDEDEAPKRGGRRTGSKAGSRRSKSGKPGINLTLADLQGQFGVGLKEAAAALGVCTTTLKRACRRHGIQRWPRRALQKVSKTLDEMERRGTMRNVMAAAALPMGSLIHPTSGQLILPPAVGQVPIQEIAIDSRWAAVANMIPIGGLHANGGQFAALGMPPSAVGWTGAAPAVSDYSLDGAVAVTNNNNNANNNATVATGFTQNQQQQRQWDHGTAAGAAALAEAAEMAIINATKASGAHHHQQQQHQHMPPMQNVVPPYMRATGAGGASNQRSPFGSGGVGEHSMGISDPNGPVLQLPSFSLSVPNLSNMSAPLPSFMAIHGTAAGAAGIAAAVADSKSAPDDVGLLDSTILELMLNENSRGLVGASDEDLKRLFSVATTTTTTNAQPPQHT